MKPDDPRLVILRRLALCCAVVVFAVTSLSAYIRLSKAGLGCADWPACYGQSLRSLQQGQAPSADEQTATAVARLAHRIVAVVALLLVVGMVAVCFGNRPVLRREGALALALLGLALALAVLGRWSSAARVPAVAMGNLLGGFAMLALCARLAVAGRPTRASRGRAIALLALLLVLVQLALGGLVSASFAGSSCGGWRECVEAGRQLGLDTLNPWREPVLALQPPINPSGALAQLLHRCLGLALALLLVPVAISAWRRGPPRAPAVLLLALLVAQLSVGLWMAQGALALAPALAHNQLAALMLALLVLML